MSDPNFEPTRNVVADLARAPAGRPAPAATIAPWGAVCGAALARLRAASPLVHNITNDVVMTRTADALIAAGASPAMVHAEEEAGDFAAISAAVVLNMGTLTAPWLRAATSAARAAAEAGVPVVFDPVACAATSFRRLAADVLLNLNPAVIRGNASEILALAGLEAKGRGVDTLSSVDDAADAARGLASARGIVVVASGPVDLVTDGQRTARVANGHRLLARITGTGCTATALIGAFLGSSTPPFDAAVAAMAYLGLAGERAAFSEPGPGTFAARLMDELAAITPDELAAGARVA